MRILVTGAGGFVGSAVCRTLTRCGHCVRAAIRADAAQHEFILSKEIPASSGSAGKPESVAIEVGPETDWTRALSDMDAVIHLAARRHSADAESRGSLPGIRAVNVAGTERLARMAAAAGVRRMVFASTVKVNGESTDGSVFTESGVPAPGDAYAISKWEAELALRAISGETSLETVILRPPLVYGPGVGGNFLRMMRWIKRGIPLPLGSVRNSRSLIYLDNLVDALVACVVHPGAANRTYLVSDGEDVSSPELVRRLGLAMGVNVSLIPVAPFMLRLAGRLTGKTEEVARLVNSLQIDTSRIRSELQWTPPCTLDRGLRETAAWYAEMAA